MSRSKSYMIPKLIFLNMLALMMITFEHEAPADNQALLRSAPAQAASAGPSDDALLKVAANQPSPPAQVEKPVAPAENSRPAMRKTAVYKTRVTHKHASSSSKAVMLKTNDSANSPLGCCFRGNRI